MNCAVFVTVKRVLTLLMALLLLFPAETVAGPAATFQGDPQAIAEVQAAYGKFGTARSYRVRMTVTSSSGSLTQTMEIVVPDRTRIVGGQGNLASETTVIGQEIWVKGPGVPGGCIKSPARIPVANPREAIDHSPDAKITVARGGQESVEGTATRTYNLTIELQGKQFRQKLYVATGTGFPRRVEMPSDQGTATFDYFDFDAQIAINPPC